MSKRPSLFSVEEDRPIPHTFNTGTIYDLLTGKVLIGHDGKYYLCGGLTNGVNGGYGPPNSFKSSMFDTFIGRTHAIYDADTLIGDAEGYKDEDPTRLTNCAGDLGPRVDKSTIKYISGARCSIGELYEEIKQICKRKSENEKDYTFESPFMNVSTGKRAKAWLPTIIELDSWSEMFSTEEQKLLDKEGLDGDKIKTIFMAEGAKKTTFIRQIRRMCENYGLVVAAIAHKGEETNMSNPGMPVAKKTQQMKQGEKLKNVGSKFYDLTRNLVEIVKSTELKDSSNEALYKYGEDTPVKDVNEIMLKTIRCKSNMSGPAFPFVASQFSGMLQAATHYHYMRLNGYQGMNGSKMKQQCVLKPDTTISRNTVRENADKDYELARALEICARFLILKNFWVPIPELADVWKIDFADFYERLQKNKSPKISDILNSVGYWYPDGTCDREYLSIFDILKLTQKGK